MECSICLDTIGDPWLLQCGHAFHAQCIHVWFAYNPHRVCPLCLRREIPPKDTTIDVEPTHRSEEETASELCLRSVRAFLMMTGMFALIVGVMAVVHVVLTRLDYASCQRVDCNAP